MKKFDLSGLELSYSSDDHRVLILLTCPSLVLTESSSAERLSGAINSYQRRSVVQRVFKIEKLLGANGFPDFGGQLFEFVQVTGGFNC